jgi:hypothetical protein
MSAVIQCLLPGLLFHLLCRFDLPSDFQCNAAILCGKESIESIRVYEFLLSDRKLDEQIASVKGQDYTFTKGFVMNLPVY